MFSFLALTPQSTNLLEGNKVNELFMKCISQIVSWVMCAISKLSPNFDQIVLTGHGLGQSLAVLAVPLLAYCLTSKFISRYTFGAPKVGDQVVKRPSENECTAHSVLSSPVTPYHIYPCALTSACIQRGNAHYEIGIY